MHTIRTPENQAVFLCALMETASVSVSCRKADVARSSAYLWRKEDPEFAAAWEEALQIGMDALEDEAIRRAHEGTARPVFYEGQQCGEVREYSDTLMIFLLKGGRPEKYRERYEGRIGNPDGTPLSINVTFHKPPVASAD